jgi:ribosomal protein S27E
MVKKISLQIDHINGIRSDNRIENLRILCPNCHSQTETFSGKNARKIKFCSCGETINRRQNKCKSCSSICKEKIIWPTTKELIEMILNMGYRPTCRKLGVSDPSIRRRLENQGIDPKLNNLKIYFKTL